jgi:C-terminal processing protease CtpA/Prc
MLAPEENVARNDVYLKRGHNKDYAEELRLKGESSEQRFQFKEWAINGEKFDYDLADANIGITKLYALTSGKTASASEALLIGLRPYLDIEIIGETTRGKFCGGYNLLAADWYLSMVDTYREEGRDFYAEHPDLADWKTHVADWGMYVITHYFTDKTGTRPDFSKGLSPDFKVADAPFETYPLGDEREVLLHAALTRAGKTDLPSRGLESRSSEDDFLLLGYPSSGNELVEW